MSEITITRVGTVLEAMVKIRDKANTLRCVIVEFGGFGELIPFRLASTDGAFLGDVCDDERRERMKTRGTPLNEMEFLVLTHQLVML